MLIVDEAQVKEEGTMSKWLIGPWNSSSKTDFGVAFFQPDQLIQKHIHERVEEIFYVIEGQIVLLLDDNTQRILTKGNVAFIPPKQVHGLHNRSNTITKFIIVKFPSIASDKTYIGKTKT